MLALRNTPGALDALAKEIFKQSGSPPTGNSDDGGTNDTSMFFGVNIIQSLFQNSEIKFTPEANVFKACAH